jgi:hypothetical protein
VPFLLSLPEPRYAMNKLNFLLLTSRFSLLTRSTALMTSLVLLAVLLTACQPQTPTVDPNAVMTQVVQTAMVLIQQTKTVSTPLPTKTAVPTPTLPQTPPALPSVFTTSALNPQDTPHTYINDACQYLKAKWTSTNAAPGTIVITIMFHGIIMGQPEQPQDISVHNFEQLMNALHDQGFTAINMQQMMDFMYNNAKVPQRSVLLIQDDRRTAQNFTDHFLPYYKKWGWPVVSAWISFPSNTQAQWQEQVNLEKQGWVDHEAHGVIHNIVISESSSDDYIHSELYGSIQAFQQYFDKTPIAYVWPGGGFTPKAVQVAREAGYKLGFTDSPRGPMMFNWVPLDDQTDPQRPDLIAEGSSGDPLMTLPRTWDTDAQQHLGRFGAIGDAAAAYAQQNKAVEMQYYNIVCAPKDGPIP